MPIFQSLPTEEILRETTDAFTGLDLRDSASDGALSACQNMSGESFPLLSSRRPRGVVKNLTSPQALCARDVLCYVDRGTVYINGLATGLTGLSSGEKQLVNMGAYLIVFPDKKYINTSNLSEFGDMEASYSYTGTVRLAMCDSSGTILEPTVSAVEPESPVNDMLWLSTADGLTVYRYSAVNGIWAEESSVYTRVSMSATGEVKRLFNELDGVELTTPSEDIGGSKFIMALGGEEGGERDYIVVTGIFTYRSGDSYLTDWSYENAAVTIRRSVPDMDFVIQCRNRLWGCKYGMSGNTVLNELYCSALGDFKNFRRYLGEAGDSWAASLGSDGQFTGAVSYLDSPIFFKENCLHRVNISASGAHSVTETVCRGVQKGSHKSLCVMNERLYYKSSGAVCVWQGGFPESISDALGNLHLSDAVSGSIGDMYYISAVDRHGVSRLFSCDTARGIWYEEDGLRPLQMAALGEELYCIDSESGALLALRGTAGAAEEEIHWSADSCELYYQYPDRKYVSRFDIRLSMEKGARAKFYIMHDSSGIWEYMGSLSIVGGRDGAVTVPVRPRRCDHMKMRICGSGGMKLRAVTRCLCLGSDV